jgi:tripartite-type tricarboxylate transporter receptor subunit TctC
MVSTAAGLALASSLLLAHAADFPTKPIRVVSPFSAGTATDVVIRSYGDHLQKTWKQPIIIENRPGAGGLPAYQSTARSAPDGYTIVVGNTSLTTLPFVFKDTGFEPLRDLVPVTQVVSYTTVFVINPNIPAKSMQEFVAWVKANPGKVNYSSQGAGGLAHLTSEMIIDASGAKMTHVPYQGTPPGLVAVMNGDVHLHYHTPDALQQHQAGKLRIISVVSDKRMPELPDVATLGETNLFPYVPRPWNGFLVAAGTPRDIVQQISTEVQAAARSPEVMQRLRTVGATAVGSTSEEFTRLIQSELKLWAEVTKRIGIVPQ